jgi:hypothetical protein
VQFTFPKDALKGRKGLFFDPVTNELHDAGVAHNKFQLRYPTPAEQSVNPGEIWITIKETPPDIDPEKALILAVKATNRTIQDLGLAHRYTAVGTGEMEGGEEE